MRANLPQRLGALAVRVASIVAGALVLKHEVYDTGSAEVIVIALGLWLIGVPPALWLDALRRAGKTLDTTIDESRDPGAGKKRADGDGSR